MVFGAFIDALPKFEFTLVGVKAFFVQWRRNLKTLKLVRPYVYLWRMCSCRGRSRLFSANLAAMFSDLVAKNFPHSEFVNNLVDDFGIGDTVGFYVEHDGLVFELVAVMRSKVVIETFKVCTSNSVRADGSVVTGLRERMEFPVLSLVFSGLFSFSSGSVAEFDAVWLDDGLRLSDRRAARWKIFRALEFLVGWSERKEFEAREAKADRVLEALFLRDLI